MGFASFSTEAQNSSSPLSRGAQTELSARKWLETQGLRILLHRFETPFAEIDLLAMRPSGSLVIYEVKSSFWPDDRALGLGQKQRRRLEKAAFWIASETSRETEILLLAPSTRGGQFLEVPIF